jgi:hypothetical protein
MTNNTSTFRSFALGQIVATHGALDSVPLARMNDGLSRHVRGDWGTVCAEDGERNTEATREGLRIVSAYPIDPSKPARGYGSNVFWIITEADRSATTILLPDEY